jgi:Protein of unknown function (DUF1064)
VHPVGIRTKVDGRWFGSKGEAGRYKKLKSLLKRKKINKLIPHPRFPLYVNGVLLCTYVADFEYYIGERRVVEDYKGYKLTPEYKLKKKLMKIIYGIEILETHKEDI